MLFNEEPVFEKISPGIRVRQICIPSNNKKTKIPNY